MENTVVVISKVLPVVLLIVFGSVLRRTAFLRQSTIDELKKITVNVALPSLLFLTFSETTFEIGYLLIFLVVFLIICAAKGFTSKGDKGR